MCRTRLLVWSSALALVLAPLTATAQNFLDGTEIDAWVGGSYNFNFADMDGGAQSNANPLMPFHTTTHGFQLDQAQLEIDKGVSAESRVGGHVGFVYGEAQDSYASFDAISTAYMTYLADVMGGLQFDAGILPTLIGAESVKIVDNFNITRGVVWAIQPITSTGLTSRLVVNDQFSVVLGVYNDPLAPVPTEADKYKAVVGGLAYDNGDGFGGSATVQWGKNGSIAFGDLLGAVTDGDFDIGAGDVSSGDIETGIFNVVLTADFGDSNIEAWLDYTLRWDDVDTAIVDDTFYTNGLAAAARYAVSEVCGVALRAEVVHYQFDDDDLVTIGTLTLTSDYTVYENLTFTGEVRLDWNDLDGSVEDASGADGILPNSHGNLDEDVAGVILVQAVYRF